MDFKIDRRWALKAGAALTAAYVLPVGAQAKPTLRFAAVFSDKDIRADMIRMFAKDIEGNFKVEPYYAGTLFKQGTELVALQRDNLEMGNIAPQDISKQIPAWSILTSAYLFRDANHLNAFFVSDLGAQMKKMVEDQLKVKILGPTFFGTRQVGLKSKKKISTPADMAGIKLRMPPGDAWQLLGRSIGANPTPMAYAGTRTPWRCPIEIRPVADVPTWMPSPLASAMRTTPSSVAGSTAGATRTTVPATGASEPSTCTVARMPSRSGRSAAGGAWACSSSTLRSAISATGVAAVPSTLSPTLRWRCQISSLRRRPAALRQLRRQQLWPSPVPALHPISQKPEQPNITRMDQSLRILPMVRMSATVPLSGG